MNWKSYEYLYQLIFKFQKENSIIDTCDPFAICIKNGWKLIPYSKHPIAILTSISEDGFSEYKNNEFYIFYNDNKPLNRQKFTIAHEIGHIYLYHHLNINNKILSSNGQYLNKKEPIWETQANIFAQNILITVEFAEKNKNKKNTFEIAKMLNLSEQMVKTRLSKLHNDKIWINRIKSSSSKINNVKCHVCGNTLVRENKHCEICGEDISAINKIKLQIFRLNRKDVTRMKFSKIEVNDNSKAIKCPVCGNTAVVDGEYCQICGINITNRCTNDNIDFNGNLVCGILLPGDARYCPQCGAKSTFYESGLLNSWDNEHDESNEDDYKTNNYSYDPGTIPF